MIFLFTRCAEPCSHRDQVRSSVHWAVLGLCEELEYLTHLTFQVQEFTRGLESRVFFSATSVMPLLVGGWNHQIPTLCWQSQSPGKRFLEKGDQRGTAGASAPGSQQNPQGAPTLHPFSLMSFIEQVGNTGCVNSSSLCVF